MTSTAFLRLHWKSKGAGLAGVGESSIPERKAPCFKPELSLVVIYFVFRYFQNLYRLVTHVPEKRNSLPVMLVTYLKILHRHLICVNIFTQS